MRTSIRFVTTSVGAAFLAFIFAANLMGQEAGLEELRFTVDEVTETDISAIPNDGGIVFTLLGDLYRLPVTGGDAVQITTGPYFHKEPAVSPDGSLVAVVSNRDPRKGDNIYLLDLGTLTVRLLTSEVEAGRPAWSPDGKKIAFLAFEQHRNSEDIFRFPTPNAVVKELDLASGRFTSVTDEFQPVRDVTYGPAGELYWIRIERTGKCTRCSESLMEKRTPEGEIVLAAKYEGAANQLRVTPEGIFYSIIPTNTLRSTTVFRQQFGSSPRTIAYADMKRFGESTPRFAVASGKPEVYTSDWGHLWKIDARRRTRIQLHFDAYVRRTVYNSAPPPKWTATEEGGSFHTTLFADPVISPDGKQIAFEAAGKVWLLPLGRKGERARPVNEGVTCDPAFSPDGKRLAYVRRTGFSESELLVTEGLIDAGRVVVTGNIQAPAWSPDGRTIIFRSGWELHSFDVQSGKAIKLLDSGPWLFPAFTRDGRHVITQKGSPNVDERDLVRFSLDDPGQIVTLTDIGKEMKQPKVSPNGRWLAFRRGSDLWIADLETALKNDQLVSEDEVSIYQSGAGLGFSFDPSGDAVLFNRNGRIFRGEIPKGEPEVLVEPLTLPLHKSPDLEITDVRVLLADGKTFSEPTDLYVKGGRIIGQGARPADFDAATALVIDGRSRFAVPGLWDGHLHGGSVEAMSDQVLHGVTSYRDPGSEIAEAVQETEHDRAFGTQAPRRFFSGEIFEGYNDNYWGQWNRIDDPVSARTLVSQWAKMDVRFIKAYRTLSWPLHYEIASAARENGLPVTGHGIFPEQIVRSVVLGYRNLEHQGWKKVWHDDLLKLMSAAGVNWSPQFVVGLDVIGILALRDPDKFRESLRRSGLEMRPEYELRLGESVGDLLGEWYLHSLQLKRAAALGVRLIIGTDNAGGPGGIHIEMEAFQDAGFEPYEVLRMATLYPATAEGVEDDLGTLETGKLADLLLLEKDPLEDISNLRMPSCVIRGGSVIHCR